MTKDRLNSSTIYGTTRPEIALSTDVGIGSAADDLSGSRPMTDKTSSAVTDANAEKLTPSGTAVKVGGGELSVD